MTADLNRTTIGQLVFPVRPVLNFARLVADLDGALGAMASLDRELTWDHDDVALLDLGSSRIALAVADGPAPGGFTITVSAGWGPREGRDARLAERRHAVARLIADRIAARFVPARTIWTESPEVATPELFDRMAERLDAEAALRPAEVRPLPVRRAGESRARPARILTRAEAQADLPRLLAEAEAAEARGARPSPAANDALPLTRSAVSGLEAVRAALYATPEDYQAGPSPTLKLAAHAFDAALIVVALPVGAAMMTYTLMRGADVRVSARMTALCGIGIAALQGASVLPAMGFLPGLA